MMRAVNLLLMALWLFAINVAADDAMPLPQIAYSPRTYVCYQTMDPLQIDGQLSEPAWQATAWTALFTDIEGDLKPKPRFATRAKMLWDSTYFYVGAELEEPDVWGKLTERDAVIYQDNDFEVFIDPDGDTHEYYELEVNALNTVWDLFLVKPYRDGGPAVNAWDIQGLKTAVAVRGTLNTPGDRDSGWSVEIAIPWKVLAECAHRPSPPNDGDQWRVNFSRVEWQMEVRDSEYVKLLNSETGKSLPEDNWVWSPQGLIAMHYPEMWGIVQFSTMVADSGGETYRTDSTDYVRWELRTLYYAERSYQNQHGTFTSDHRSLTIPPPVFKRLYIAGFTMQPQIKATAHQFRIEYTRETDSSVAWITQDGQCRVETK